MRFFFPLSVVLNVIFLVALYAMGRDRERLLTEASSAAADRYISMELIEACSRKAKELEGQLRECERLVRPPAARRGGEGGGDHE